MAITLTMACGAVAYVDEEDVYQTNFKWCLSAGYPSRRKSTQLTYLHWEIIGKPPLGFVTDHINGNRLDNRRLNLRHITQAENMQNTPRSLHRTGVSVDRTHGTYKAYIDRPGKPRLNLGTRKTKIEAQALVVNYNWEHQ